jgi:arginine repressor
MRTFLKIKIAICVKGEINMAKANVIRKNSLGIKGVLNVDKDSNSVVIEIEDGEALELASLLDDFNGSEVSISVGESIDIA